MDFTTKICVPLQNENLISHLQTILLVCVPFFVQIDPLQYSDSIGSLMLVRICSHLLANVLLQRNSAVQTLEHRGVSRF